MRPVGVTVWSEVIAETVSTEDRFAAESDATGASTFQPHNAATSAAPDITIIVFIMFARYDTGVRFESIDAFNSRAQRPQALFDALVTAVDLVDVVDDGLAFG